MDTLDDILLHTQEFYLKECIFCPFFSYNKNVLGVFGSLLKPETTSKNIIFEKTNTAHSTKLFSKLGFVT